MQSQWTVRWDMLITQHDASLYNFTSGSSLTEEGSGVVVVGGGGSREWRREGLLERQERLDMTSLDVCVTAGTFSSKIHRHRDV